MPDTLPFGTENTETLAMDIMAIPSPPPSVSRGPSPSLTAEDLRASYQGRNLEDELGSAGDKPGETETAEELRVPVPPPQVEDCSASTPSEEACVAPPIQCGNMGNIVLRKKRANLDRTSMTSMCVYIHI